MNANLASRWGAVHRPACQQDLIINAYFVSLLLTHDSNFHLQCSYMQA